MYDATKLQDDERLSGMKRDGIAGVDHHVDIHGIETLLLQWNIQSRIKYAMHVSLKLGRFVDAEFSHQRKPASHLHSVWSSNRKRLLLASQQYALRFMMTSKRQMTPVRIARRLILQKTDYDATKLKDDERLSGKTRYGIAGVDNHVNFHVIETLLLQRNVQSRIKYAMHISLKRGRFVDYSKNGNVFQQIAVDVYGANV